MKLRIEIPLLSDLLVVFNLLHLFQISTIQFQIIIGLNPINVRTYYILTVFSRYKLIKFKRFSEFIIRRLLSLLLQASFYHSPSSLSNSAYNTYCTPNAICKSSSPSDATESSVSLVSLFTELSSS